jgi:hypothetical protein
VMTPMRHEGKEVSAIRTTMQGQQGRYNARAILVMVPAQQGQQCHSYNGKDACASTMVMTPLWQGWGHQLEDLIDAIAARAATIFQQWQRCLDCKDACTSMTPTSSQWGQQPQLDNSKEACSLMTAMIPLLRGQQHQLDDYASLTALEMPSQQGQQSPLQRRQRCLHINSTMPSRASITIATTVKTPAHQQQRCHHDEGNDASFMASDESNNDNSTMAMIPSRR